MVLFSALSLATIAECLRAQPEPESLIVYLSIDGFSRDLTDDEQCQLDELLA